MNNFTIKQMLDFIKEQINGLGDFLNVERTGKEKLTDEKEKELKERHQGFIDLYSQLQVLESNIESLKKEISQGEIISATMLQVIKEIAK